MNDKMNDKMIIQLIRIADALEKLVSTELIEADASTLPTTQSAVKEVVHVDAIEDFINTPTHGDLKTACITSTKSNVANKPKIKGLLAKYGAVKAVDVPEDKLAEIIAKIEKGEF